MQWLWLMLHMLFSDMNLHSNFITSRFYLLEILSAHHPFLCKRNLILMVYLIWLTRLNLMPKECAIPPLLLKSHLELTSLPTILRDPCEKTRKRGILWWGIPHEEKVARKKKEKLDFFGKKLVFFRKKLCNVRFKTFIFCVSTFRAASCKSQ